MSLWHPMSREPGIRQRVLLLKHNSWGPSVSLATYERVGQHPFPYCFQCECGWFPRDRFDAWISVDDLVATAVVLRE